jgi:hypothetical protein
MRDWWRVVLSAVLLVVSSADCTADCDNPHANRESAGILTCGSVGIKAKQDVCQAGFDIGYYVACTSACTDDELDADVLKSDDVVDSSCAEPHTKACAAGFRAGIDLGAGLSAAALDGAEEAEAAAVPVAEEAAAADPATCSAKCEDPPHEAKRVACRMHVNPKRKAACEFGFDTGFMVMCGQACEDATMDKDIFKSEDVVGSTCEPGADKKPCADGFKGGVDSGAAVAAGDGAAAAAAVKEVPVNIREQMKAKHQKAEGKKSASAQMKKDQAAQAKREQDAAQKKKDQAQSEEDERQRVQAAKREAEQKKAAGDEDEPILDGKAKEAAVKAAARKQLQDAEEVARLKWLKEEEEAEEKEEAEREAKELKDAEEARLEATQRMADRGKRSKEQVKRDKKNADEYAKAAKAAKKKKRGRTEF